MVGGGIEAERNVRVGLAIVASATFGIGGQSVSVAAILGEDEDEPDTTGPGGALFAPTPEEMFARFRADAARASRREVIEQLPPWLRAEMGLTLDDDDG